MYIDEILEEYFEFIIVGLIVIMVAVVIYFYYKEQNQWESFKTKHNCVVIKETASKVGIDSTGKAITIPASTTYKCDDGKEYER